MGLTLDRDLGCVKSPFSMSLSLIIAVTLHSTVKVMNQTGLEVGSANN